MVTHTTTQGKTVFASYKVKFDVNHISWYGFGGLKDDCRHKLLILICYQSLLSVNVLCLYHI